jgi:dihydroflavonol-4-reductase
MKSKIRQEEEIRDFVKESDCTTEIITLHPTFTLGPTLTKYKTSNIEAFRKLVTGEFPAVPELQLLSVDVRDVAQAHINALMSEKSLDGERIALMHKPYQFIEQMNIIREHFYEKGLT